MDRGGSTADRIHALEQAQLACEVEMTGRPGVRSDVKRCSQRAELQSNVLVGGWGLASMPTMTVMACIKAVLSGCRRSAAVAARQGKAPAVFVLSCLGLRLRPLIVVPPPPQTATRLNDQSQHLVESRKAAAAESRGHMSGSRSPRRLGYEPKAWVSWAHWLHRDRQTDSSQAPRPRDRFGRLEGKPIKPRRR